MKDVVNSLGLPECSSWDDGRKRLQNYFDSEGDARGKTFKEEITTYIAKRHELVESGNYFTIQPPLFFFKRGDKRNLTLNIDEMFHIMTIEERTIREFKLSIYEPQLPAAEITKKFSEFQLHSLKYGINGLETEFYKAIAKSSYGK
eukprot:GHVT01089399.1.p1 GENE.GHVT01089399.1~~GHVT01089399.1.p1  ORF type:complete len:146 (+),score=7.86 GHVT01089399.1:592-1029(+)